VALDHCQVSWEDLVLLCPLQVAHNGYSMGETRIVPMARSFGTGNMTRKHNFEAEKTNHCSTEKTNNQPISVFALLWEEPNHEAAYAQLIIPQSTTSVFPLVWEC